MKKKFKSDYILKGFGFFLRSIRISDAKDIVDIRLYDKDRNRYISDISNNIRQQDNWLKRYLERDNDFYFMIKNIKTSKNEGLISIYNVDHTKTKTAELGRWVIYPGSLAALESIYLAYKFSFEIMNLHKVYTRTVSDNHAVISFHESIGASLNRVIPNHFIISKIRFDAVEQYVTKLQWKKIRTNIIKLSKKVSKKM